MFLDNLKYSITLEGENVSTQVPQGMQFQSANYSFDYENENYFIHLYPDNKMVVVISGKETSTILSNVELTKVDDSTVDIKL